MGTGTGTSRAQKYSPATHAWYQGRVPGTPGTVLVLVPLPVLQYEVPGTPGRISWTIPWHTAGFHRSVGRIFYQNVKKNSTPSTTG